MTLGAKIASGFGSLIAISMVLGGLAAYNMKNVEKESAKLAEEYVPEVEYASGVELASLRLMYAMRGYGLTQEQHYYDQSVKDVTQVEKWLQDCDDLSKTATHLVALAPAVKATREQLSEYKDLMAQTVALDQKMAVDRTALDEAAAVYVTNCNLYLEAQNRAMAEQIEAGDTAERLQERLYKITEARLCAIRRSSGRPTKTSPASPV